MILVQAITAYIYCNINFKFLISDVSELGNHANQNKTGSSLGVAIDHVSAILMSKYSKHFFYITECVLFIKESEYINKLRYSNVFIIIIKTLLYQLMVAMGNRIRVQFQIKNKVFDKNSNF